MSTPRVLIVVDWGNGILTAAGGPCYDVSFSYDRDIDWMHVDWERIPTMFRDRVRIDATIHPEILVTKHGSMDGFWNAQREDGWRQAEGLPAPTRELPP